MKKRTIYFVGIVLFGVFILWKQHLPHHRIVGKYVNNNTEVVLEGPLPIQNGQDTLVLYDDFTFESKTWGKGTYTYDKGFWESRIDLSYTYIMGKAGYNTIIEKSTFGKVRILLSRDLGFYFEKID